MNVIDIAHTIEENMAVYSADTKPVIKKIANIKEHGYRESKINIFSHNGTHIDAPYHMISNGKTLDDFTIDNFVGKAIVIDVSNNKEYINKSDLKNYEKKIIYCDYIIFKTSWWKKWGSNEYFKEYPVLTEEAVRYLISFNIKGIGLDTISVDSYNSINYEIHNLLLSNDKLIIENLTNLDKVPDEFFLVATPLKYKKADGCPVRAIAII